MTFHVFLTTPKGKESTLKDPLRHMPSLNLHGRKEEKDKEEKRFQRAVAAYPLRNGKKLGISAARTQFSKLSADDQERCILCIKNYAASAAVEKGYIQNFYKFIRDDRRGNHPPEPWREWFEPETPTSLLDKNDAAIKAALTM